MAVKAYQESALDQTIMLETAENTTKEWIRKLPRPTLCHYYSISRSHSSPVAAATADDYTSMYFRLIEDVPVYNYEGPVQDLRVEYSNEDIQSSVQDSTCCINPGCGITPVAGDILLFPLYVTDAQAFLLFRVVDVAISLLMEHRIHKLTLKVIPTQVKPSLQILDTYRFSYVRYLAGINPILDSEFKDWAVEWHVVREALADWYVGQFVRFGSVLKFGEAAGYNYVDDMLAQHIIRTDVLAIAIAKVSYLYKFYPADVSRYIDETIWQYLEDRKPDLAENIAVPVDEEEYVNDRYEVFTVLRYGLELMEEGLFSECSPGQYSNCTDQTSCEEAGRLRFSPLYYIPGVGCVDYPDPDQVCNKLHPELCVIPDDCYRAGLFWWADTGTCSTVAPPDCSSSRLDLCIHPFACEKTGGYWWDNFCHAEPRCHSSHPENCITEQECLDINGFWFELACHMQSECELDPSKCETELTCLAAGYLWYDNHCHSGIDMVTDPATMLNQTDCEARGFTWENELCVLYPACHETTPEGCMDEVSCIAVGGNWWPSLGTCAITPEPECNAEHLETCDQVRCVFYGLYWWQDACHAEPECDLSHPEYCLDEAACVAISGFWYEMGCHAEPLCRPDNLGGCLTQLECEGISRYWWQDACHAEPECDPSHPEYCSDEVSCVAAGGYWYNTACNTEPELVCSIYYPELCAEMMTCVDAGNVWTGTECIAAPAIPEEGWHYDINPDLYTAFDFWPVKEACVFGQQMLLLPENVVQKSAFMRSNVRSVALSPFPGYNLITESLSIRPTTSPELVYRMDMTDGHVEYWRWDGTHQPVWIAAVRTPDKVLRPIKNQWFFKLPDVGWRMMRPFDSRLVFLRIPGLPVGEELMDVTGDHYAGCISPGRLLGFDGTGLYVHQIYTGEWLNQLVVEDSTITAALFANQMAVWKSATGIWYAPDIFRYLRPDIDAYDDPVQLNFGSPGMTPDDWAEVELRLVPTDTPSNDYLAVQYGSYSALYDVITMNQITQAPDRIIKTWHHNGITYFKTATRGTWAYLRDTGTWAPMIHPDYEVDHIGDPLIYPDTGTSIVVRDSDGIVYVTTTQPNLLALLKQMMSLTIYPPAPDPVVPDMPIENLEEVDCLNHGNIWASFGKCLDSRFGGSAALQREILARVAQCTYTTSYQNNSDKPTLMDIMVRLHNGDDVTSLEPSELRYAIRKATEIEKLYLIPMILAMMGETIGA